MDTKKKDPCTCGYPRTAEGERLRYHLGHHYKCPLADGSRATDRIDEHHD